MDNIKKFIDLKIAGLSILSLLIGAGIAVAIVYYQREKVCQAILVDKVKKGEADPAAASAALQSFSALEKKGLEPWEIFLIGGALVLCIALVLSYFFKKTSLTDRFDRIFNRRVSPSVAPTSFPDLV